MIVTGTYGGQPATITITGATCEHVTDGHHALCQMAMPDGQVVQSRIPVPEHMTDAEVEQFFAARARQILG